MGMHASWVIPVGIMFIHVWFLCVRSQPLQLRNLKSSSPEKTVWLKPGKHHGHPFGPENEKQGTGETEKAAWPQPRKPINTGKPFGHSRGNLETRKIRFAETEKNETPFSGNRKMETPFGPGNRKTRKPENLKPRLDTAAGTGRAGKPTN